MSKRKTVNDASTAAIKRTTESGFRTNQNLLRLEARN